LDPVLLYIITATLLGGVLSLALAGVVALTLLPRWIGHMVSFAVGALLAVAFLDVLPEALRRSSGIEGVLATLLGGLLLFFLLEKAALWRHSHAGAEDDHHGHGHAQDHAGHSHHHGHGGHATAAMVLVGDGFHNFVDGILIAAAFMADPRLGVATAAAVMIHEIPQEIGDFMVLLTSGYSRRRALFWNFVSSLTAVAGGVLGYLLLDFMHQALPYVLALASASFIYVAMADLIPSMQRRWDAKAAVSQVFLIAAGIASIAAMHYVHV
jgi:zinc and cadmium transporter